jgi:L-malate glycosyltransferase
MTPAVLHVVWNLIRGGTEGQCARIAMHFAGRGDRHRVAVFRREGFFLSAVEKCCGPVHAVDIHRAAHPHTVAEVLRLARWIRRERFDRVHCWDADAAIFGGLAACWAGVPFITSRRDLGQIYAPWKCRLMAHADRRARAVVVNAKAIHEQRVAHGLPAAKIHTIPNVLDLAEFDQLRNEPCPVALPDGKKIMLVARLDPEKDIATALQAVALLRSRHPDARLIIAGDGTDRSHLEALAAGLHVAEITRFLGDVTYVPALLRHGCVGLLTPRANEGLANTILEYMAAGLPVVATCCGGNRELVSDRETGRLVEVGDAAAVAAALADVLEQPEEAKKMGEKGRARILAHHQIDPVARQFSALYGA